MTSILHGARYVGFFLVGVALLGWLHPFVLRTSFHERPLAEPLGIAVDREGRIYCGIPPYFRIQVYAADGTFVASWPYRGTAQFRLRINDRNQLEVADAYKTRQGDQRDVLSVYDHTGRLLSRTVADGVWTQFGASADTTYRFPHGDVLMIQNRHLFPHIEHQTTAGVRTTIVRNSWFNWFIMAPLPPWFWLVVGGGLLRYVEWRTKTRSRIPSTARTMRQ